MSETFSEEFDGRVLNPAGVEIDLPFWVFKQLKKLHLIERDHASGKRRICGRVFGLMEIWDGPDFRHELSGDGLQFSGIHSRHFVTRPPARRDGSSLALPADTRERQISMVDFSAGENRSSR
jgi:hypothetical protein